MQGQTPAEGQVRDLTAYLRTLAPPPSLARLRGEKQPGRYEAVQVWIPESYDPSTGRRAGGYYETRNQWIPETYQDRDVWVPDR